MNSLIVKQTNKNPITFHVFSVLIAYQWCQNTFRLHQEQYLRNCLSSGVYLETRDTIIRVVTGLEYQWMPTSSDSNEVEIYKVSIKTSTLFLAPDCSPIWQGQPLQQRNSAVASSVAVIFLNKGRHLAQPKAGA